MKKPLFQKNLGGKKNDAMTRLEIKVKKAKKRK